MYTPIKYAQDGALVIGTPNQHEMHHAFIYFDGMEALVATIVRRYGDQTVQAEIVTGAGTTLFSRRNLKRPLDPDADLVDPLPLRTQSQIKRKRSPHLSKIAYLSLRAIDEYPSPSRSIPAWLPANSFRLKAFRLQGN